MTTGRINQVAAPVGRVAPPWRDSSLGRARASRPNPSFSKILKFRKGHDEKEGQVQAAGTPAHFTRRSPESRAQGLARSFESARGSPKTSSSSPRQRRGRARAPVHVPCFFSSFLHFLTFDALFWITDPGAARKGRARSVCLCGCLGLLASPTPFLS